MERETNGSPKTDEGEQSSALRDEVLAPVSQNELCEGTLLRPACKNGLAKLRTKSLGNKLSTLPKLMMDGYELSLDITLDDVTIEKARTELRETPDVVKEALKTIRELAKEDPDLIMPDHDELYVRFLRPCKWYPKSAFRLIQRYFRFYVNYPHISQNLSPKTMKHVLSSDIMTPFPKRCINGCRVLIIRSGKSWKPKEVSLDDMMRNAIIILEAALFEPRTQISGVQVIIDMEGLSLSQVTYFTPKFAAMTTEWVQKCLPCRLKNIHVVYQPFIFNMVYAFFKPFLSEKLRKRIHFHGTNMENLLAAIGPDALPTKYGGNLNLSEKPLGEKFWEYMCYFEEEFEEFHKIGYVAKT